VIVGEARGKKIDRSNKPYEIGVEDKKFCKEE
jgi:hypothetical protein